MTDLTCPACRTPLHIDRDGRGAIWVCPKCKGAAANLAVLRKRLKAGLVADFWRRMVVAGAPSYRPCPVCRDTMHAFEVSLDGHEIPLDLCKKCQVIWFDGGELEAAPKAEDPDKDLSPEMRQQLAVWKVQLDSGLQEDIENDSEKLDGWIEIGRTVLGVLLRLIFKA
jgi:Zn-finger nucleic acid-binding protein